jgi:hypothetical protein
MTRRLFNLLTLVSLLLCVAVAAVWVRSCFATDFAVRNSAGSGRRAARGMGPFTARLAAAGQAQRTRIFGGRGSLAVLTLAFRTFAFSCSRSAPIL